jgi:hypothetical protein
MIFFRKNMQNIQDKKNKKKRVKGRAREEKIKNSAWLLVIACVSA